jgi:hypothetical protein
MDRLAADVFDRAADAIIACVPHAQRQSLEGQTHVVDPRVLAPVSARFFSGNELDDGRHDRGRTPV